MNKNRPLVSGALAALIVFLVAACGGADSAEDRAQARWDALLSDQVERAYGYLAPGYRSSVSLKAYERQLLLQRVQWTDAVVESAECADERCVVAVTISYRVRNPVPGVDQFEGEVVSRERWVVSEGRWYHLPEE